MKVWKLSDIVQATEGRLFSGEPEQKIQGLAYDSRQVQTDNLFVPIVGERVDGHDFIAAAAAKGAKATLAGEEWLKTHIPDLPTIAVDQPLEAIKRWAKNYVRLLNRPIVGITGSTGKTTTKELVAAVLSIRYKVLKNVGSLNTDVGLPVTVLSALPEHQWLVLEMGMNNPNEIKALAEIAPPRLAVITNVGEAHIERFGSKAAIARAKAEILEGMERDGIAIVNGDDAFLQQEIHKAPADVIYFGEGPHDGQAKRLYATDIKSSGAGLVFSAHWQEQRANICFPWPGRHNVYNITCALAVGIAAGISLDEAVMGLANFEPPQSRLSILNIAGYTVLDDSYNANPASMEAALRVLRGLPVDGKRIAVLGDMLEMGKHGEKAHREVGDMVASLGIDMLITVGSLAVGIAVGALAAGMDEGQVHSFFSNEATADFLAATADAGQAVLIKGSRSMEMERIIELLLTGGNTRGD